MSLHCLAMFLNIVCLGDILYPAGRFSDVQSSMNWVRVLWAHLLSRLCWGSYCDTKLKRLGIILSLVSAVALHLATICSIFSSGGR